VRKFLLGTASVLGAGLVASPAIAADGIKLSVGGFFREAYLVVFDDDDEGELGNQSKPCDTSMEGGLRRGAFVTRQRVPKV